MFVLTTWSRMFIIAMIENTNLTFRNFFGSFWGIITT